MGISCAVVVLNETYLFKTPTAFQVIFPNGANDLTNRQNHLLAIKVLVVWRVDMAKAVGRLMPRSAGKIQSNATIADCMYF